MGRFLVSFTVLLGVGLFSCAYRTQGEELSEIWEEVNQLEAEINADDGEAPDCQCDCSLKGDQGPPGMPGDPGKEGEPGPIGVPGVRGAPAPKTMAPIGPLPEEDPRFIDSIKQRWKGYAGPYGTMGSKGDKGKAARCSCEASLNCKEFCTKVVRGLPGLDGLPGPKGDRGEPAS